MLAPRLRFQHPHKRPPGHAPFDSGSLILYDQVMLTQKEIHFAIPKEERSFLRTPRFIHSMVIVLLLFLIAELFDLIFRQDGQSGAYHFTTYSVIFFAIYTIASAVALIIFLYNKNTITEFVVDTDGIRTEDFFYSWNDILHYHWLGEAQEERVGFVTFGFFFNYDLLNPYRLARINIARIRLRRPWYKPGYLNLQISSKRVREFEELLQYHGIMKLRARYMYVFGIPGQLLPTITFLLLLSALVIILLFLL